MMVEEPCEGGECAGPDSSPIPAAPASLNALDADAEVVGWFPYQSSVSPPLQQQTNIEASLSDTSGPPSEAESPDDMIMVPHAEDKAPIHSQPLPLHLGVSDQYSQLIEVLSQQHQRCLGLCQQFTHMGKVAETARFESLAEECSLHLEVVKQEQSKQHPLPPYNTEERNFEVYRIIPSLTGNDMLLTIVKGINLPIPTGLSSDDMDTSVRFDFPCPSLEEGQRDQTRSVRGTTCPEFNEHFQLHIKRGHRGFKRVIQSKGITFEVVQKGGLFKTDKIIGSAVMKLNCLERHCESRQLIEVMNRRKATRAHLEVEVKIREPLGGPQLYTVTEQWLTLDPLSLPTMAVTKHTMHNVPVKKIHSRSSVCSVL
ncbi:hypothetical protein UPYG_G00104920 [Umbra pygmaea]|uniref:C2 domain-containing protein n=1 Tax=Umbra pygmaea TaxID=75934 RepID=A0ABD0X1N6_UMBPY